MSLLIYFNSSVASTTTTKTQDGVARIQIVTAHTQTGAARITATTQRTQTGVARIQVTAFAGQTGLSRVQITTLKTQTGVSNIATGNVTTTKTQTGVARVQVTDFKGQTGVARIQVSVLRTQNGLARIQSTVLSTQTGVARIQAVVLKTQTGVAKVEIAYTREAIGSLPTTAAALSTPYTTQDFTDVVTVDGTTVDVAGTGYLIHQFKKQGANNSTPISITWEGKTTLSPTTNTVYLQIFNVTSGTWETLDSNSSSAANTNFILSGSVTSNLSDYYTSSFTVAFRVYQGV